MHVEIEVALNFIISYLYNKLPRRRVNIFGEELEKALKHKFQGHWYPDKPVKGSAFRCFKTGDTPDPVLEIAAVQSGVLSADILENLPHELSVWIDPGEVSYRIGEKGVIKILYSASNAPVLPLHEEYCGNVVVPALEPEPVPRTFNPEAQCFKPMESLNAAFVNMSMGMDSGKFKVNMMGSGSDSGEDRNSNSDHSEDNLSDNSRANNHYTEGYLMDNGQLSAVPPQQHQQQQSNHSSFLQRQQPPSTFTIASFAATKFGSTKLKTSSKRNNRQFSSRMSPVEFQNYMKQRTSLQQPPFMQSGNGMMGHGLKPLMSPSRSISPGNHTAPALSINSDPFYFHNNGYYGQQQQSQAQQPYLGSHQMGYGSAATLSATAMNSANPANNGISSSITSISSASSSSASSSVSSTSLGDHLLFGGQFADVAANNQGLSNQIYNFYAGNEAQFMDNSFFSPLSAAANGLASQFEDCDVLETTNPTKFGVIGGGLGGHANVSMGQQDQVIGGENLVSGGDINNHIGAGDGSGNGSPASSNNSMENLQSNGNGFYNGSSNSPFPQLLVAN